VTSEAELLEQWRSAAVLARLAPLLRRAMPWLARWAKQGPEAAAPASAAEGTTGSADHRGDDADSAGRRRDSLPWWVAHHPAVSFRGQEPDERNR